MDGDDTTEPAFPDEHGGASFLEAQGRLSLWWANAELSVRWLLDTLTGTEHSVIFTSELGGIGLESALGSFANSVLSEPIASHVRHVADYYNRLRGYRNHYVHNVVSTFCAEGGEPEGYVIAYSAKARAKEHIETIKLSQVTLAARRALILHAYASTISAHLLTEGMIALPEKPSLPPMLRRVGKQLFYGPARQANPIGRLEAEP